jgi:peptidoglycan/xylan/chitin deacetylase (PgdA/CDA1 family)
LLTFDDGVADHAEVVAPILDQRGLSGVFFVSGSALVGGRVDAAHQIHRLQAILGDDEFDRAVEAWLARNDPSTRWFDEIDMAIARSVYHYETSSRAATKYLLSFSLPIPLRNEMLDALLRQYLGDPRQLATEWYLRPEDLRRMQSDGHTIGGHGFTHEPLERLSAAERRRDIRQSHDMLRLVLGEAERPFSFPYGSFDEQIVDECQAEGFAAAFTTQVGWIGQRDDEGCLNRVDTIKVEEFVGEEIACPRLC